MDFECLASASTPHIPTGKGRLKVAILLCLFFMAVEISGGLLSKSLAIITDATHLLSDITGFGISLFSISMAERAATKKHSFGFYRSEILGSLASIFVVWSMNVWLIVEAVHRIWNPQPIDGKVMLITSMIGIAVNVCLLTMLHHKHEPQHHSLEPLLAPNAKNIARVAVQEAPTHSHTHYASLNLRAAAVHAIGDFIQSIGVLIASVTIWIRPNWVIVDPLCTLIFCLLVFVSTWVVASEGLHILMEGTPGIFDLAEIEASFLQGVGVLSVHELHVWTLKPGIYALSVHVVVGNSVVEDWERVLVDCQKVACQKHGIHHTVIQVERGISYSHCRPALCRG